MKRVWAFLANLIWANLIWAGLTWLATASPAFAHEIRPVFLDIRETLPDHYEATWKRPVFNGAPLAVAPQFGDRCTVSESPSTANGSFAISRLTLSCTASLAGASIVFDGLPGTMVDALVRLEFASGEVVSGMARPDAPTFAIPFSSGPLDVLATYLRLGVEHILFGYDHLLFVFALVLLVQTWRRLLTTATAFTIAHSITLSLAALGVVHVPVPPVEAMIALSILLLALELLRARADPALAAGFRPATLAFGFGLLHGIGFASALADIGLPRHEIPVALLSFNIGVELGQIAFIAALLILGRLLLYATAPQRRIAYVGATYAVGSLAAFWTIERVAGF